MKITKEQLKQIIKEELSAVLNEDRNDLIDNHGWEYLLQSRRFISGDLSSPLDGPWNQAEILKHALRTKITGVGRVSSSKGLEAIDNLQNMVSTGHPSINPKSHEQLYDFLDWAFKELQ